MPQEGMPVQIDGSHHAWVEDHGPKLVLLIAVDDATGAVAQALSRTGEDTRSYLMPLDGLSRQWGIPPGPLQRPPRSLQIQCPPGGRCLSNPPSSPG